MGIYVLIGVFVVVGLIALAVAVVVWLLNTRGKA